MSNCLIIFLNLIISGHILFIKLFLKHFVISKSIFFICKDHRIGLTLYNIDDMMEGDHLQTIVEKLIEDDRNEKFQKLMDKINKLL